MEKSIKQWMSLLLSLLLAFTIACNNEPGEKTGAEAEPIDVVAEVEEGMHSEVAQEVVGEDNELDVVLQDYMAIKDAMVEDNFEEVKQEATDLQNSLQEEEMGALSEAQRSQLREHAGQLAQASDIASQREHFAALSNELYDIVKNTEGLDQTLYWQHCPMAMNNTGANWLSMEEQVQNPYMGQRMPRCGSVQETITP